MRISASWTFFAFLAVAAACGSPDADPPGSTAYTSVGGATGTADATTTGAPSTSSGVGPSTTGVMDPSTSGVGGSSSGVTTSTGMVDGTTDGSLQDGSTTSTTGMGGSSSTTGGSTMDGSTMGGSSATDGFAAGGSSTTDGMGGTTADTTGTTTGGMAECASGPLDAPIPNCSPEPVPDTGDYYADCVARINQFRWECQCLPPLDRWVEAEDCADQQAEYDYGVDSAHAGIQAGICSPGGNAQNECPDYGPNFGIVDFCLQQMWDEGPGDDFQAHGHYINMSNEGFSRVACGMYVTPQGNVWAVQNFQ